MENGRSLGWRSLCARKKDLAGVARTVGAGKVFLGPYEAVGFDRSHGWGDYILAPELDSFILPFVSLRASNTTRLHRIDSITYTELCGGSPNGQMFLTDAIFLRPR